MKNMTFWYLYQGKFRQGKITKFMSQFLPFIRIGKRISNNFNDKICGVFLPYFYHLH